MIWFFRKAKGVLCDHHAIADYVEELEPLGVSLGWGGRPELIRQWRKTCPKCGNKVKTSGYIPYRDLEDFERDEQDWPLKPNGEQYPIVSNL